MSVNQTGKSSKTSAAVVAGVGVATAGVAALQNVSATASGALPLNTLDGAPKSVVPQSSSDHVAVSQAASTVAGQQIDELVQAYLGEGDVGAMSAEALSAADLQDVLMEQEDLQELTEHSGVQVAQSGGGVGEFFESVGGTVGGGAGAGALLVGGGLLGAGLIIDEVSGSN